MSERVITVKEGLLGSPHIHRKISCKPTTSRQMEQTSNGLGASWDTTALSAVVVARVTSSRMYPMQRCAFRPSVQLIFLSDDGVVSRSRDIRLAMVSKDCCPRSIVRQTYSRRGWTSVTVSGDTESETGGGAIERGSNDFVEGWRAGLRLKTTGSLSMSSSVIYM